MTISADKLLRIAKTTERLKEKLSLPQVKISIGAGLHTKKPLEEWINIDGCENPEIDIVCEFADIPLPNECADFCEMGDIVEHVVCWREEEIWKEWNRVVKIGGKVRISTPNLHRCCVEYANGNMGLENLLQNIYAWRTTPYEQHYITYTVESLTALLNKYGYGEVDFTESPGVDGNADKSMSWWLVCSAVKLKNI